jgi:hypothetical protein
MILIVAADDMNFLLPLMSEVGIWPVKRLLLIPTSCRPCGGGKEGGGFCQALRLTRLDNSQYCQY